MGKKYQVVNDLQVAIVVYKWDTISLLTWFFFPHFVLSGLPLNLFNGADLIKLYKVVSFKYIHPWL